MDTVSVWLPFPPSVNNLFSQGLVKGKVRRFPSRKYRGWRKEAGLMLMAARLKPVTGPVSVRLLLAPPTSARRDVDNYSKAVLDALVDARVLSDDSQVVRIISLWAGGIKPGVIVEIGAPNHAWPEVVARAPLLKNEEAELARIKREGIFCFGPTERIPQAFRALVTKGYVRTHQSLIGDQPQAFELVE